MSQPTSSVAPSLQRFRHRLDALDHRLVGLLCQRSSLSVSIARLKRVAGLPLRTPRREGEILRQVRNAAQDPLTPLALERIFRVILTEMRSAQRRHTTQRNPPGKTARARRPQKRASGRT